MIYHYRCTICDADIDVEMTMMENHPKNVLCPKCEKKTGIRVWGKVIIPENFKAMSLETVPWEREYQGKFPKGMRGKYF